MKENKRGERRFRATCLIKKRVKQACLITADKPKNGKLCGRHLHQLADRKPFDCGRTQCPLCRRTEKKRKKIQEYTED